MSFWNKLLGTTLAAIFAFSPIVTFASDSREDVLEDMSSLSIREIHKFAAFATKALSETHFKQLDKKLESIKAISTRRFYEQYSKAFSPGSKTYSDIQQKQVIVEVTEMGTLYANGSPKQYEYLIPVSTKSVVSRAVSKRDRFVSITVVKTSKGIRLSNYNVYNIER